jgi:hypothetical protein
MRTSNNFLPTPIAGIERTEKAVGDSDNVSGQIAALTYARWISMPAFSMAEERRHKG